MIKKIIGIGMLGVLSQCFSADNLTIKEAEIGKSHAVATVKFGAQEQQAVKTGREQGSVKAEYSFEKRTATTENISVK